MKRLFFVVPAYRRLELTQLCLEQLVWTCAELRRLWDIEATAVVVADDENLDTARELGFWTVRQENSPLGRKFNDGIELACQQGADYVVPCGTDNWVHPSWFGRLPVEDEVICHRLCVVVRADGQELAYLYIDYDGADGIRIFPADLLRKADSRPAADYRDRAIDASIVARLQRAAGWERRWVYHEAGDFVVVGFQSDSLDIQLNDYEGLKRAFGKRTSSMPWHELAEHYPRKSVERMERYFAERRAVAA